MSIKTDIYDTLIADSDVTDKLASWTKSATTKYAIFSSTLIPDNISTDTGNLDLKVEDSTINYYLAVPIIGNAWIDTTFTVSCRAYREYDAEQLQQACYSALNRTKSASGTLFTCTINPIIPPQDNTDNYNAVLEVRARGACLN